MGGGGGGTVGYIYSRNLAVVHQVDDTLITRCRKMLHLIENLLNAVVNKSVAIESVEYKCSLS